MIRKAGLLASVVYLLLISLSPGLAQAQTGITILASSVEAEFPAKLTFNISAQGSGNITDIRLHYTVAQISFAQTISEVDIDFEPANTVNATWTWDMRRTGGLPPGTILDYWWTVIDSSGNRIETTPAKAEFDDNRYPWHSLTEGKVTIFWYKGSESFAAELMSSAHQALGRLTRDTGAYPEKTIKLYIYATSDDLRRAMVFPQEWTGGVSFGRHNTIAIGISSDILEWGKRAIAHELTHQVIYQVTVNPYSDLPVWLDEGLAMYNEGALMANFQADLDKAIAEDSIISVRSLSSPFSAFADQSYLSYAESYSVVDFLISTYGQAKMLDLLNTFRQGSTYDRALVEVYGFDTDGLNGLWRDYIMMPVRPVEGMNPALAALLAGMATAILLIVALSAERWTWRRGW